MIALYFTYLDDPKWWELNFNNRERLKNAGISNIELKRAKILNEKMGVTLNIL